MIKPHNFQINGEVFIRDTETGEFIMSTETIPSVRNNSKCAMLLPIELVEDNMVEYLRPVISLRITDYESYLYYRAARRSKRDGGVGGVLGRVPF